VAATVDGMAHAAGDAIAVTPERVGDVVNPGFITQAEEIAEISADLTDRQKIIAELWEDGSGTAFPPGTFMSFAHFVSARHAHDPRRELRHLPAPRGGAVAAPFAEYTSDHSGFSAAAAAVLERFTGSDAFGGSVTFTPSSTQFVNGVPEATLELAWATFSGPRTRRASRASTGASISRSVTCAGASSAVTPARPPSSSPGASPTAPPATTTGPFFADDLVD
jgi:hypothetical protein